MICSTGGALATSSRGLGGCTASTASTVSYSLPTDGLMLKKAVTIPSNKTLFPEPSAAAVAGIQLSRDFSPYTDSEVDGLIAIEVEETGVSM